jgi:NitT/TauT family transport system ATP-binding protein
MSAPVVTFHSATKRFGAGPVVLDRVDLAVRSGDFVSLIGPSGCGKSTLLRVVAGLTPLESGEVRLAADAAAVAFVFQEATLLPWLTAGANVEVPLQLRGLPPAQRAEIRHRMLTRVRLAEKGDAFPRQLSGGQKMRVSLARALALAPALLLLDEPFGALDEMTREHLNEELLALRQQESWTALFVTHSVMEAVFLSNRIIVMAANPGRIHAEIPVPLPYPRTPETRLTPEFQALVAQVSRLLRSVEGAALP